MRRTCILLLAIVACTPKAKETQQPLPADPKQQENDDTPKPLAAPDTYDFESRFDKGKSSVVYNGQTFRHTLIDGMTAYIDGLNDAAMMGPLVAEDVKADLTFFYAFDAQTSIDLALTKTTTPPALQATWKDISASGAKLSDKIAGKDVPGPYKDFNTELKGFDTTTSADGLADRWLTELSELAETRSNAAAPIGPDGKPITKVHVTVDGLDYRELLQKFLLGAVAFSQGTDDYLDDDVEGSGLLADNEMQDGENPYTKLEHAWDEAYGYFGAARDFGDQPAQDITDGKNVDTNDDGKLDLKTEYNWGHAQNAAKRDAGSKAATDFMTRAFRAFVEGRTLIVNAKGPLDMKAMSALRAQRNVAVRAWEEAIAATVVHYLNEQLVDLTLLGGAQYDFMEHAKHFSECKGFALSFQFNPDSPLTPEAFEELHLLLGDKPIFAGDTTMHRQNLLDAKALMQMTYGFADENMGEDDGTGGW